MFVSELGCGTTKFILWFESCTLTTIAKLSLGSLQYSAAIVVRSIFTHFPVLNSLLSIFTELFVYSTDALLPWLFLVILLTCRLIVKCSSGSKVTFLLSNSCRWRLRMASSSSFSRTWFVKLKWITFWPLKWSCRFASVDGKFTGYFDGIISIGIKMITIMDNDYFCIFFLLLL